MDQTLSQKKNCAFITWEDELTDHTDQIIDWRNSAFEAAIEKLQREHGNIDIVMKTGEAFGRGLFAQQMMKDRSAEWTIKEWLQEIEKDVLKPLDSEFTFTKVSSDAVTTFMSRDPAGQHSSGKSAESLFNLGVMRGLFLSAFPKGELVLSETTVFRQPEFLLKTHASIKDKLERERLLERLTILKKKNDI